MGKSARKDITMSISHRSTGRARAGVLTAIATLGMLLAPGGAAAQSPWSAQHFPNVALTTHTGAHVHFQDLIRNRTVAIELIYTQCQFACPLETARLAQVQALLGDRMGKDVFFYSISIDPAHDTPAALKAFARKYHAGPGWTFLTGTAADIELLSKKLGLYSKPDPENKDGHVPTLLMGNESTGQWLRGSALDNPKLTATMITGWLGNYATTGPGNSYTNAKPILVHDSGQYLFSTKCIACHSLGHGSTVGPDLAGITHLRDRAWLARYIASPDEMLHAGDPVAKNLFAKYKGMRMPNLELTDQQITDVIAFLDGVQSAHP
jgi:protein SCO1/2